jgi:hypothetical protein
MPIAEIVKITKDKYTPGIKSLEVRNELSRTRYLSQIVYVNTRLVSQMNALIVELALWEPNSLPISPMADTVGSITT